MPIGEQRQHLQVIGDIGPQVVSRPHRSRARGRIKCINGNLAQSGCFMVAFDDLKVRQRPEAINDFIRLRTVPDAVAHHPRFGQGVEIVGVIKHRVKCGQVGMNVG